MVLSLPSGLRLVQRRFHLSRSVQATALRGGGGIAAEYAPARWIAEIETVTALLRREANPVHALIARLKGGVERIYMSDWLRKWPVAYPGGFGTLTRHGGGAFDGTATVTTLTAQTIALSTLPDGFALAAGDMIGLSEGAYRGLYRIVADATASGAGTVTVTVEPEVATSRFSTAAVANLASPVCVMQLTDDDSARAGNRETASFSLTQVPF